MGSMAGTVAEMNEEDIELARKQHHKDMERAMLGNSGKTSQSDGSTASYYELPPEAKELQDIISAKDMNAQIGEIFRACMRYGQVAHSPRLRDAKKIKFYIEAEIARLELYGE